MDEFLKACGATGPLQLLVENRGLMAMRWHAPQPFALLGSDPDMDLCLEHPRVDGQHAYLQMIDGGVYCVDLGSQSGTRWENGPARSGWLHHPQGIGIGPYVVQLASEHGEAWDSTRSSAARSDPLSSRPKDSDDLPRVILEFRRDTARPIRWRMRHVLTLVGTSPHCKVRLAAPGVMPFHCSLLRTSVGMWVVNLLGHGGVTVNGLSIRASRLDEGDELRIGDILVRVIYDTRTAYNGQVKIRAAVADERARSALLVPPGKASRELVSNRSKAAWMASGREPKDFLAERIANDGELTAPMLALVLDQFGQMQQQFLNQFQQTALMMFRALGTLHRDQMEELRERLESLHQIGENLQALQAQMSATVALDPSRLAHEPGDPIGSYRPPPSGEESRTEREGCGPDAAVTHNEASAVTEHGDDDLRAKIRSMVDQPNIPSLNVHEWLIGRLAAIENEQRSRWQRILDMVRRR